MNIPESVIHRDIIIDGEHVAQVIENTLTNRRHDFITSEEKNFQFGSFFLSEGESIRSHQHLENRRSLKTTTEFIFVQVGVLTVYFYGSNNIEDLRETVNLGPGSAVIIFAGIHGFSANTDCRFFEIKQGPFNDKSDKIKLKF